MASNPAPSKATLVKICGINTEASLQACLDHGADWVGFNFYSPSPRAISLSVAKHLTDKAGHRVKKVGVFVNPTMDDLSSVLSTIKLDIIQLHGRETPEFIEQVKHKFHLPVIKSISIESVTDLEACYIYENIADYFLFDSKPPRNIFALPGGNAKAFDWTILKNGIINKPWLLAGGLHTGNLRDAVLQSGALAIDTASGVEDKPGFKNPEKIRDFLLSAKQQG